MSSRVFHTGKCGPLGDFELGDGLARGGPEDGSRIAAVGEPRFENRPAPEQGGEHKRAAIAVPGLRQGRLWILAGWTMAWSKRPSLTVS